MCGPPIAAILVVVGRPWVVAIAVIVSCAASACGGSVGGDTTVEPAEVAAFCDEFAETHCDGGTVRGGR